MSLSDIPRTQIEPLLPRPQKIFDGHNDMLYQLWTRGDQKGQLFLDTASDNPLCLCYQRAQQGGLAGGLFAIFVPANSTPEGFSVLSQPEALQYTHDMLAIADYLAESYPDKFALCRTAEDITKAEQKGALAAVLHIEGKLSTPHWIRFMNWQKAGALYRALMVAAKYFWTGRAFFFSRQPRSGQGLTTHGKALVKACDAADIMLDVSHLNEAGFWDIANLSEQPLIASHSNVHALCPSPRNLTDAQLDAIAERGGLVGACFATAYLRADGVRDPDTEIDLILRQFDYLISRLGEDHVGFGSDFDGAVLPASLATPAALPALLAAMQAYGFGEALIAKLSWDNWLRQLA